MKHARTTIACLLLAAPLTAPTAFGRAAPPERAPEPPGDAGAAVTAALDRLEATLGPDAGGEAEGIFSLLGRLADGRLPGAVDVDDFADAAAPIPGADDLARSRARDQRTRGAVLWIVAKARGLHPPAEAVFRPWVDELDRDVDAAPARLRGLFLLALAATRAAEGGDAAPSLARLGTMSDLRPAERVLAAAFRTTIGGRTDPRPERTTEAMTAFLRSVRSESPREQVLAADAVAAALPDPAAAWCDLFDLADETSRVRMLPALLARLASVPCQVAVARPLHLLALERAIVETDLPAAIDRFAAIAADRERPALRPLAMVALARCECRARRYREAVRDCERYAEEYPDGPGAADAIDLAIFILAEGRRERPSTEDDLALLRIVRSALDRFPAARQRADWLVIAAEVAHDRGEVDLARRAADELPPGHVDADRTRLLAAETTVDAVDRPRERRAELVGHDLQLLDGLRSALAAEPSLAARAAILAARHAGLAGDPAKAAERGAAVARDASILHDLRGRALVAIIEAQVENGVEVVLPPDLGVAAASDPDAWWPSLRAPVRAIVDRILALPADAAAAEAKRLLGSFGPPLAEVAAADGDGAWRLRLAEALLRAGACDAVQRVFPASESHTAAALLLRAEARRLAGAGDEAMRLFREATDASAERSVPWWQAELGQLRVAAATPANVDAVRARIHWLRGLDHALGGPPVGPAIEALLRSLPDRP